LSVNGEELAPHAENDDGAIELVVADEPTPTSVEPEMAFVGETQIPVQMLGTGFLDTPSLSCRAGDLVIFGTYGEDPLTGIQWVDCTIAS
jgi:hypothetical protein